MFILFGVLVLLVVGLIYFNRVKIPLVAVESGELQVRSELSKLNKNEYVVLNDMMVSNGRQTSQIDHVVVSLYGVFVLETKNYKGVVGGVESSELWTHTVRNREYKFYSPIRQNSGHVKAVKEILEKFRTVPVYSIIVFTSNTELNVDTTTLVVSISDLLSMLSCCRHVVATSGMMHEMSSILSSRNITDTEARRCHISSVHSRAKQANFNAGSCPECGGRVGLRSGRLGSFYGCNNYPTCKYTRKIQA